MKKEKIESAVDKLELVNITLHESNLVRGEQDPFTYPSVVAQQSMIDVSSEEVSYSSDGEDLNLFRTFVSLGIRAVNESEEDHNDDNIEVFFTIEAVYRVDYILKENLTDEEAKEFSKFNSVHNVWPFWRQHVFETVRAGELPQLIVPLMRGMNIKKNKRKSKALS